MSETTAAQPVDPAADPAPPVADVDPAPVVNDPPPSLEPAAADPTPSLPIPPDYAKVENPLAVLEREVENWFTHFFGSIPVGWDTAMRNHVREATDDLKRRFGI